MTAGDRGRDELMGLLYDLAEDRLTAGQAGRLEELLAADPAKRQMYVDFMLVVGGLHRMRGAGSGESGTVREQSPIRNEDGGKENDSSSFPHINGLQLRSIAPTGRFIFAYAAASLILTISVLIGWVWDAAGRRAAENEGRRPKPLLAARAAGRRRCRPDHGDGRLPMGRPGNRRRKPRSVRRRPQVRAGLRPAEDQLRRGRIRHSAGSGLL